MASKFLLIPIFSLSLILLASANPTAEAEAELVGNIGGGGGGVDLVNETLEWEFLSLHHLAPPQDGDGDGAGDEDDEGLPRRSLYWNWPGRRRYYISYGALSANRVPCPARSGRSYYTHNCFRARGPVNPYYRSCSAITRCRS